MMRAFADVSRDTQLRRVRKVLGDALAPYGLSPRKVRLLRYEDNAVYRVSDGPHLVTVRLSIRDGRSAAEQRSELRWMRSLLEDGVVRVPRPAMTDDGQMVVTVASPWLDEPATAVAFEWIPGRMVGAGRLAPLADDLGALTASLHVCAQRFTPPEGFVRPSWQPADVAQRCASALLDGRAAPRLDREDAAVVRSAGAAMVAATNGDTCAGLIHADVHRENIPRRGRRRSGGDRLP